MQIWQSVSLTAVKRIYFCVKRGKKVAVGGTTVCFLFYFSNRNVKQL